MQAIESVLSTLEIRDPVLAGNLAVFPLFRPAQAPMDYLLLDEAIEGDLAHVTEVSQAGSVPELAFENASPRRVLLVDGDELVGARQNRIVNISILVGAGKKLVIPVSCVEQGRWSYRSAKFSAAKRSLFASAKARKMAAVSRSMREMGSRRSDQGEVWADIGAKIAFSRVASETSAMADVYEAIEPDLAAYERSVTLAEGQVGAVFACGDRVVGLEFFDSPAAFARCFAKIVRAYATDARERAAPVDQAAALEDVKRFLAEMTRAAMCKYKALGDGEDVRLEGDNVAGGALVEGERVVHLAAYRVEAG